MFRRHEVDPRPASLWLAAAFVAAWLAGCSTEPYRIEAANDPPWELFEDPGLPEVDPPLSARAYRIELCYGQAVNTDHDVLARAEELCGDGRLVLEKQNVFWNGCSILQPNRVTYVCDPPDEAATPGAAQGAAEEVEGAVAPGAAPSAY